MWTRQLLHRFEDPHHWGDDLELQPIHVIKKSGMQCFSLIIFRMQKLQTLQTFMKMLISYQGYISNQIPD